MAGGGFYQDDEYSRLRTEAERLESHLREELIRFAVPHADKALSALKEANERPVEELLENQDLLNSARRASEMLGVLRDLLRK